MKNISYVCCFNSILYLILSLTFVNCSAQTNIEENQVKVADTTEFNDSAHHWYDINDEEKIIEPWPTPIKFLK